MQTAATEQPQYPTAGLDGQDAQTAFRMAEKSFKFVAPTRDRRRGRRAQAAPQATPQHSCTGQRVYNFTDTTHIAELLATGCLQAHQLPVARLNVSALEAPAATVHEPEQPAEAAGQTDFATPPTMPAYTLPAHPGLLVIPGALTADEQLCLTRCAFTLYPEPPAHTNHEKLLGPLPGLWTAAQQGLVLRRDPAHTHGHQDAQTLHTTDILQQEQGVRAQSCSPSNCSAVQTAPHGDQHSGHTDTDTGQDRTVSFEQCWADRAAHPSVTDTGAQCSQGGASVSRALEAVSLLRRLRHAVLGPLFDWTNRCYRLDVPHRRLPTALRDFAVHWGQVAEHVAQIQSSATPVSEPRLPQTKAPFLPDAALVHYYYAGDTLMGHRDDVEPDLSQPIISVSLGCDAVFLMGGATKDETPTPILLRSGDVLVLGGRARCCYHGVPRVFTDSLAPALTEHPVDDSFAPFLEHLRQCRINISIRAVC